jgi:WXXGXW repeat (2 copies)
MTKTLLAALALVASLGMSNTADARPPAQPKPTVGIIAGGPVFRIDIRTGLPIMLAPHRVWIPGHWVKQRHHRTVWVAGHYDVR